MTADRRDAIPGRMVRDGLRQCGEPTDRAVHSRLVASRDVNALMVAQDGAAAVLEDD
jgi:hypothetical protein